jgi:hypothetical protein
MNELITILEVDDDNVEIIVNDIIETIKDNLNNE